MINNISISDRFKGNVPQLDMPPRILLGPGPANVDPRILAAMSVPPVGHLDPTFLKVMDEIQDLLRYTWQTENEMTIAVAGTGTAAMEATMANSVEPGDKVLIGVKGYFGNRLVDMVVMGQKLQLSPRLGDKLLPSKKSKQRSQLINPRFLL